jgi:mannosyltransferase OCH1-like enzyme
MKIPRIIHQIWIQGFAALPEIYRRASKTWQEKNQGCTYKLWDDEALQKFMYAEAPDWLPLYQLQPEMTAKSDVARYALLFVRGGLYADTDTECLRPVAGMLEGSQASLFVQVYDNPWTRVRGRPPQYERVANAVLASVPAHPVWRGVRAAIEQNPLCWWVTARTGPMVLEPRVTSYAKHHPRDVCFWDHRRILTSSLFPRVYMRSYGFIRRKVCVLDFNDSARADIGGALAEPHKLMAAIARDVARDVKKRLSSRRPPAKTYQ